MKDFLQRLWQGHKTGRSVLRWSQVRDGLIFPPSHLELIVADHCNLRCRACNHGSPGVKRWYVEPAAVFRDLSILAQVYRPPKLVLIGGEPLLHKQLLEVIEAARKSAIAPYLKLITNGMLLHRMPDAAWELLDEVEVSHYPGVEIKVEILQEARKRARKLTEVRFEQFRETYAVRGTADDELVQKVYSACKIANVWGCHGVRDGFFYKCPQSMYMDQLAGCDLSHDRVRLESDGELQARILNLVNSHLPLQSCRYCAGTCGKQFDHQQAQPGEWTGQIERSLEEIVDFGWLEKCQMEQSLFDDCKIENTNKSPLRRT